MHSQLGKNADRDDNMGMSNHEDIETDTKDEDFVPDDESKNIWMTL